MISSQEKRWVWIFCLIVLCVTTIPYLLGYLLQGEHWSFTGFFFGVEDGNSYIAKMLSGASGAWLFQTPYTSIPQNGVMAFLPYLLLGKLTASPAQHDQLLSLFQAFRWGAGISMIWATYQMLSYFVGSINLRRWGVVLSTVGGGFGWLSVLGLNSWWSNGLPLEFYSPESFGFLSLLGLPHLAFSRALFIWGLLGYLKNGNGRSVPIPQRISPGLMWLAMGFMQPLTIVTAWVVLGAHQVSMWVTDFVINKESVTNSIKNSLGYFRNAVLMVVISSPIVIYTILSFSLDPFLKAWSTQNLIMSPPIGDYILAFGAVLPFVIYGIVNGGVLCDREKLLLFGWVLMFPFLAYAPYNLQRRLPDGIWVALILLSVIGISGLKNKILGVVSKVWLAFSILPALMFLVGGYFIESQVQKPLFLPTEEIEAFLFIRHFVPMNSVVLAQYSIANPLPAWAHVKTVIGHGPESAYLSDIQPRVDRFFANALSFTEQVQLLNDFDVGFVLLSPAEQDYDFIFPNIKGIYEIAYENKGYLLLKVIR